MSRGQLAAAGAVGIVCALLLLADPSQKLGAPGERTAAPANPEARPAHRPSHEERRTVAVALPQETAAAIGSALEGRAGRAARIDAAIAEARAGRIDAVELGRRLREGTAGHPELGPELLGALQQEHSPALALQMAQALAGLEGDAPLRAQTIAALRAGTPESRAVGLLALLGRGEPEALELAEDALASDAPGVRATAAFVLGNAPVPLTGPKADRAFAAAHEALADRGADAHLREEAATLLGRPGAPESDVALLERMLFEGEPAVRMRALAAFEATGVDRARLRSALERVARDGSAPPRLVEMAKAWLAANP